MEHLRETIRGYVREFLGLRTPAPPAPAVDPEARRALVEQLAASERESLATANLIAERHAHVATRLEQLTAEVAAAEAERVAVYNEGLLTSARFDLERNRIEAELRATASPALAEARARWSKLWETARLEGADVQERRTTNPVTGQVWPRFYSNHGSVEARMTAIREALAELDVLELAAVDEEALVARLAELEAGFPAVAPVMWDGGPLLTMADRIALAPVSRAGAR